MIFNGANGSEHIKYKVAVFFFIVFEYYLASLTLMLYLLIDIIFFNVDYDAKN